MDKNEPVKGWNELTERDKAYLCFMVFTGKDMDRDNFKYPDVEGLKAMSYSEIDKTKARLEKKGFLRRRSFYSDWYYYDSLHYYEVDPAVYMRILCHLMTEKEAWMKVFQRHRSYNDWHENILKIAKFMCGKSDDSDDDMSPWNRMYLTEYGVEIVECALTLENWERLVRKLNREELITLLSHLLTIFERDGVILNLRLVKKIFSLPFERDERLDYFHSRLRKDWFYYTGEVLQAEPTDMLYHPTHYLEATQLLYSGEIDKALTVFENGIKVGNKFVAVKGMPQDALSLLVYVIALGIRRRADDVAKLQGLSSKIKKLKVPAVFAVELFVTYLKDAQQVVTTDYPFLKNDHEQLTTAIVNLFRVYVGEKPYRKTLPEAMIALLKNEMWGMKQSDDKGDMPGDPLLGRIPRKEPWEVKIGAIIEKAGGTKDRMSAGYISERVVYYAVEMTDKRDYIEVKVQKRLKNGNWSKGSMLSESNWSVGNFEMDDIDRKVYGEWKKHRYEAGFMSFPPLTTVLRYCKGTDKLYTYYSNDEYGPVEIVEESPYIYTERKGGKITFVSNIPDHSLKNLYEWSKDRRSITYWSMDEDVRELYGMVVKLGSVPEKAEPMLEQMMVRLKDKVDVQSDVKGAMQLEEREGISIITVRVTPSFGRYEARFMVRPLEGGYKYVEAYSGDEVIVDSDGEARYKVVRNLKGEKSNCKKVCDLIGLERLSHDALLDANCLLSLMDNAEQMNDVYCIEWPKGEGIKIIKPSPTAWNINAVGKAGWFEIEGELRVSEDRVVTIAQLLEIIRGGEGQYVRLSSGEYLKLSKKIRSQLSQLDAVSQTARGKIAVPELAMTFMKDALDDLVDVEDYKMVEKRKKLMREAANKDYPLPEGLNAVLRPYQEDGYRWLMSLSHWGAGACLADDMGLGKTVQSIAFMLAKAENGPQMVVAPASVVGNWRKELARFSPSLRVTMLNEVALSDRATALDGASAGCVVVTTYGLLVTEKEAITGVKWETVVLDEAHTIKNRDTKMSAVAMKLQAANKIMLTGTPVQNHLGELWNLFRFINPGLLGSYEHFQEKFAGGENNGSREALKRLVAPFLLRRTKNEVVKELPDKVEVTIPVKMDEDEMAVYEVIRREAKAELELGGPLSVNALAMMTKLRMAACSAMLAEKNWKGGCSKLDALMEKLTPIIESGHSVLVFSQFTSFLAMARERLDKEGVTSYLYLDGSTPVAKRQAMVEQFQRGEQQVFLISLKAGGLGLNLTGANYVIHLDPWWNPAIEQQATDRAYRIGQQQKVTVYHLIAEGTIEEKILRLHDTKREMADQILEGRSTAMRLTPEELLELINE